MTPARGGSARRAVLPTIGPPIAVFFGFLGLWYFYSGVILDERERNIVLPYFHKVIDVAFLDAENRSELLAAMGISTIISVIGLVIAILLGVGIAVAMSQAQWIEQSFYPYAVLLQTVPILALVPLIGLRFGFGITARVIVCVLIALFPIITNTLFGLKSAKSSHHDLFTLHNAGRFTRLTKLQLPAALPAMFTGFQISAGLSIVGAIVGGFFFGRGDAGLGIRIKEYSARLKVEQLIGSIILSALLGVFAFWLFGYLKHRLTSEWDESGAERRT